MTPRQVKRAAGKFGYPVQLKIKDSIEITSKADRKGLASVRIVERDDEAVSVAGNVRVCVFVCTCDVCICMCLWCVSISLAVDCPYFPKLLHMLWPKTSEANTYTGVMIRNHELLRKMQRGRRYTFAT